jgi:choline dehydrogenase-like flavoprotein
MGSDPSATVTTAEGAVRGVEGLYVADASLMPRSIGDNPMMTIIAFSARVAQQLAASSSRSHPAAVPVAV